MRPKKRCLHVNVNISCSSLSACFSLSLPVAEGCHTAALSSVTGGRRGCCFTVHSSERELDIEMEDSVARAIWVHNIREIMFADK
jgi:hypothetical protein